MNTQRDWQTVNHELMAEQRRVLGDPPTAEQLLAYTRGELAPAEEDRVRDLLVCYPDAARIVAVPFPTDAAKPGEADFLPDAELAEQWTALQRRLHRTRSRTRGGIVQFPHALTALAAAIALVFAGLYWQAQSKLHRLGGPQIVAGEQRLPRDGRRGGGDAPAMLTATGESLLLIVPVVPEATRVEIVQRTAGGERSLWSADAVPREDQTLAVMVPRGFLVPGEYQVVVYAGKERVGTHSVRVD